MTKLQLDYLWVFSFSWIDLLLDILSRHLAFKLPSSMFRYRMVNLKHVQKLGLVSGLDFLNFTICVANFGLFRAIGALYLGQKRILISLFVVFV